MQEDWVRNCFITRVIDGDTVEAAVDLGYEVATRIRYRLYGINAPEKRGDSREAGKAAQAHLETLLSEAEGGEVVVRSYKNKTGKYGRWLGIFLVNGVDINKKMVEDGHAVEYMV